MSAKSTIQQFNRDLADKLVQEAKQNPQSPYLGKFVGFANGQIVVIADRMNEIGSRLRQAEPDRSRAFRRLRPDSTSSPVSDSSTAWPMATSATRSRSAWRRETAHLRRGSGHPWNRRA